MKIVHYIAIILIAWSCNSSSGNTVVITKEDSLEYYPPTPVKLEKQLFRRYYREVSRFF